MKISDRPSALLFDLDGVLIDSQACHWAAWQRFNAENTPLQFTEEYFISTFGQRNLDAARGLLPNASVEEINRWMNRKEAIFREIAKAELQLLPGVESFLKQVVEAKIPCAIASSAPPENLEFLLKETILGHYIPVAVSADEVPNGKPAPDVFLEAARRLSSDPKQAIMFEDTPVGLTAGRAAGCFVVAVATTHTPDLLFPRDLLIKNFSNITLSELFLKRTLLKK